MNSPRNTLDETLVVLSDFGSTDRILEVFEFDQTCSVILRFPELGSHLPAELMVQDAMVATEKYKSVLIGSGVDRDFVDYWVLKSRQHGLNSSVLIDSWVNYADRVNNLPNEIVVTDSWAKNIAREVFSGVRIKLFFPNREDLYIHHTGRVDSVLILATLPNNYTRYRRSRHSDYCVCPEIQLASEKFPNAEIKIRPHPRRRDLCNRLLRIYKPEILGISSLHEEVSASCLAMGPPSYAQYYLESIGVPAFFTEQTNENWKGPQFRLIGEI